MKGGGKRDHRHWPFHSQRTRLLCSTGLSYSLLTHIMLHIHTHKPNGSKEQWKKEDKKKTLAATENEKERVVIAEKKEAKSIGKRGHEKTLTAIENEKERVCVYFQGCPPAGLRSPGNNSLGPPTEVHSVKGRGRHVYKLSLGCPTTFWGFDQPDVSILNQNITNSENPKCCVCISSSSGIWWLPNDQRSPKKVFP